MEPGDPPTDTPPPSAKPRKKRRVLRKLFFALLLLIALIALLRPMMPSAVRWYVNRTLDQSPIYQGRIGDVDIHLWRGAYSIRDIRLVKMTGNVPVPLFAAERIDFSIQWDALWNGKVVGRMRIDRPELNFVAGESESESQTGAGGPWLQIIQDLFPFQINRAEVNRGAVHFRSYATGELAVDVYLSHMDAVVDNLTNIRDETTPLITTVRATALAMDHARFEYAMQLDPFSYRPTFHMATRLLALDVTKINDLAITYGGVDFEDGLFDLVVEVDAKEGALDGYVKPLFRNLKVLSLPKDIKEDNLLEFLWELLVGGASELLENQSRNQFGTLIPFSGDAGTDTTTDVFATIGNVLRNAFVRAYLPRLQNRGEDFGGMQFRAPELHEAESVTAAP